jgi:adenine-specific DNA-methyltransferase
MELFNDPLADGWKPENVIYEVAVKEGFSLALRVEKISSVKVNKIFQVTDTEKGQSFRICLDDELKAATVKELNLKKDELFICRDVAIDDKAAANLALQCRLKTI